MPSGSRLMPSKYIFKKNHGTFQLNRSREAARYRPRLHPEFAKHSHTWPTQAGFAKGNMTAEQTFRGEIGIERAAAQNARATAI